MNVQYRDVTTGDDFTLDNPLGLTFNVPKSERNLRATTVFREPGPEKNDARGKKEGREIPAERANAFSISQVLG